jgi:hypothetical protein
MHPLHPPWADSEAAAAALPLRRMCQGAAKKFKLARNNHNGKRLETLLEQNRIQVSKLKKSCAEGLQVKKIHFLWARVGRWSEGQGCSKKPKRRESALAAEMQPHLIKNTESQFCFIHCTPPRGPGPENSLEKNTESLFHSRRCTPPPPTYFLCHGLQFFF